MFFLIANDSRGAGWSGAIEKIPNLRPWSKITTAPTIPLRGWVSVFFEPFIELIYDTLISVITKVDPRNLMVAIIFFKTI